MPLFTDLASYLVLTVILEKIHKGNWSTRNKNTSILKTARIQNQQLALELENACTKNGGFLTYAQYLQIEQFGKNGYHSTHKKYGMTEVHKRWPKALTKLCMTNKLEEIIEFGPGEGQLALQTLLEHNKHQTKNIVWTGVEIDTKLQSIIRKKFKINSVEKQLKKLVSSVNGIDFSKKALIIFPYVLDSIAPEIFVNTTPRKTFPNAIIGITVKNSVLQEIMLTPEQLKTKGLALQNGIVTTSGHRFDLKTWTLFKGQRAYIPISAFALFATVAQKAKEGSVFLIIDEFRQSPLPWESGHLCLPKKLYTRDRESKNIEKHYKTAGENLFYYPTYSHTFFNFLSQLGFTTIQDEVEQKLANQIIGKRFFSLVSSYFTYAFVAQNKKTQLRKDIPLIFPQQQIL